MIWLLRHAQAAEGHPDAERSLTELGMLEAASMGQALKRLDVRLDTCLSSPKRRAIQTAQLVCEPIGLSVRPEPALAGPDYDPELLAAGLGETLLVGHNPTISRALHRLTGAHARLRTGGLAAIDESGRLMLLIDPAYIAALAPETEGPA